jgi:methionine-rich copper-binding protein CopC
MTGLVAVVATATPASAHAALLSSAPADGAVLTEPPTQVLLTFNQAMQDIGADIVVTHTDTGDAVPSATIAVNDAEVSMPLPSDLGSGTYQVAWRAVSADGHPIEGTFAFTLSLPVESPSPPASVTPTPTGPPDSQAASPSPVAAGSPDGTPPDDQVADQLAADAAAIAGGQTSTPTSAVTADAGAGTAGSGDSGGTRPAVIVAIAIGALCIAAAVTAPLAVRRKKRRLVQQTAASQTTSNSREV